MQRVQYARVKVDGETVGEIGPGLLLLVGINDRDTDEDLAWLAKKCAGACEVRRLLISDVQTGRFAADVKVERLNDGR